MAEKKTFRIGELSHLFHIGVDSIRYYEKVGILHPIRNPANNYRTYTIDDVRRLTLIRELLKLNFTTEQIKQFDENRNIDNTLRLLEEELHIVNKELSHYYKTKKNIENRISSIKNLLNTDITEEIQVLDLPERACAMVNNDNLPDSYVDYYLIKYMHNYQKNIDTIGACDCYTLDLPGSNPDSLYYRTKNVFFYSKYLPLTECNYFLPAGKYISILYRGPYSKTKMLMPTLYDYASAHNLKVNGDPIEFCHIDNYETNDEQEYIIEIQLPVTDNI